MTVNHCAVDPASVLVVAATVAVAAATAVAVIHIAVVVVVFFSVSCCHIRLLRCGAAAAPSTALAKHGKTIFLLSLPRRSCAEACLGSLQDFKSERHALLVVNKLEPARVFRSWVLFT